MTIDYFTPAGDEFDEVLTPELPVLKAPDVEAVLGPVRVATGTAIPLLGVEVR